MADFTKDSSSSGSTSGSTSHSDSHSGSSSMSMSMSSMVFHTSIYDPLYSAHWAPTTLGQYIGTVIFLILLAFTYRFLLAWRSILQHYWRSDEPVVVIAGEEVGPTEGGGREKQEIKGKPKGAEWDARPWRWSVDLPRAAMAACTSGVGYLLMLAVMTFNVGYFMAVLGGIFAGELVWGRWTREH